MFQWIGCCVKDRKFDFVLIQFLPKIVFSVIVNLSVAPDKLLIVIDSVYVDDSKILNILTAYRIKIFLQQNFWNPAVIHRLNESKFILTVILIFVSLAW